MPSFNSESPVTNRDGAFFMGDFFGFPAISFLFRLALLCPYFACYADSYLA
jgi:hypothetical protein